MLNVVTITYNRKDYLSKAIDSVLTQTFGEFEYYIIDDGSTDDTAAMIGAISDKRLKYIHREHSGYLSVLRNIGLDKAAGGIIAFLDSDDFWEPGYLEKINKIYSSPTVNSVISNAAIISQPGNKILFNKDFFTSLKRDFLKEKLLSDPFVIYPSCFSFRQPQLLMRFNEKMKHGDSDLFLRILAMGNAVIIEETYVNIVKHETNMSAGTSDQSSFVQSYTEALDTLRYLRNSDKIGLLIYHQTASKYLYKLGNDLLQTGRAAEARNNFLKSFFIYPLRFKALAKFLFVLIK